MKAKRDQEFKAYRQEYKSNLSAATFPWGCAYYYYMQNIDKIDVMSFTEFRDKMRVLQKLKGDIIQDTVYDTLDVYFEMNFVVNNKNAVIGAY